MRSPRSHPPKPQTATAKLRWSFFRDWKKHARTLEQLARRDDLSTEEVHDLRVATRRLRASVFVLGRCTSIAQEKKIMRELRDLGRALGARRMWEIAIRDAGVYGAETPALEKRLSRAKKELRRAMRPGRMDALIARLKKAEAFIPDASFERLSPWLEDFEWELAYRLERRPKTPDDRHQLRIHMKKVRYVIECLGRRSYKVEKLQDYLGREHDLGVLRPFVGREPRLTRDVRRAGSSVNKAMRPALESAMRQLLMLRRDIAR
jgi:CHAD domain-containing protein